MKIILCSTVMIGFIIAAFVSTDIIYEHLLVSFGIITGILLNKIISTQNRITDGKK